MNDDIKYLIEKLKPLGFKKENNNLLGPSGVKIKLSATTGKGFCIN